MCVLKKGALHLDYRLYLFDFDYTLVNSEPAISIEGV